MVGTAGTPQVFTSTGTPTAHLTESGAALPSAITFKDNGDGTATLSGTPATGTTGTYAITVTASNGTAPNATLSFTLTVDQAPAISGPASDTLTVNRPGSDSFVATGVPIPAVTESGALPSGVTFVDNGSGTGTLAGTPAVGTQGTYPLTISAHNGEGPDATLSFTLTVLPPVTITTTSLPGGTVGTAYSATLAATNGAAPYSWTLASGSLPAGLSLASNGAISGTPTGPSGTVSFVVKVTDSATPKGTATQPLSIAIAKGTTSLAVNPVLIGFGSSGLTITFGSVSATLTGGVPPKGIAGQTVTFKTGSTTVCSGVTTSTGAVRCNITVLDEVAAILANGVTATYAGSDSWLPSAGRPGSCSSVRRVAEESQDRAGHQGGDLRRLETLIPAPEVVHLEGAERVNGSQGGPATGGSQRFQLLGKQRLDLGPHLGANPGQLLGDHRLERRPQPGHQTDVADDLEHRDPPLNQGLCSLFQRSIRIQFDQCPGQQDGVLAVDRRSSQVVDIGEVAEQGSGGEPGPLSHVGRARIQFSSL